MTEGGRVQSEENEGGVKGREKSRVQRSDVEETALIHAAGVLGRASGAVPTRRHTPIGRGAIPGGCDSELM